MMRGLNMVPRRSRVMGMHHETMHSVNRICAKKVRHQHKESCESLVYSATYCSDDDDHDALIGEECPPFDLQ